MAAGKADTIETGVALASESIDSGRASEKLGALRQTSNELAAAREKE
jgi:anthranilate phosphoribosyltransferase